MIARGPETDGLNERVACGNQSDQGDFLFFCQNIRFLLKYFGNYVTILYFLRLIYRKSYLSSLGCVFKYSAKIKTVNQDYLVFDMK